MWFPPRACKLNRALAQVPGEGSSVVRQRAVVFCLDARDRIVATRDIEFTTRSDLVSQLRPQLAYCETVEAWIESVCLLRLTAHGPPEWQETD